MAQSKFYNHVADEILRVAGVEEAMDRDGMEEEDIPEALAELRTKIAEIVGRTASVAIKIPAFRAETERYAHELAREEAESLMEAAVSRRRALALIGRTDV